MPFIPTKTIYILLMMLAMQSLLNARTDHRVGFAGKKASSISDKKIEQKIWSGSESNDLMDKKFPMKSWDTHFSSLGSKRSAIDVTGKEKEIFQTETKSYPKKEFEMSQWNQRIKELEKDAQVVKDAQPLKKASNEQMYYMMLQDSSAYAEMGDQVSLRDINKFQFRRNHSDGPVPVQGAAQAE